MCFNIKIISQHYDNGIDYQSRQADGVVRNSQHHGKYTSPLNGGNIYPTTKALGGENILPFSQNTRSSAALTPKNAIPKCDVNNNKNNSCAFKSSRKDRSRYSRVFPNKKLRQSQTAAVLPAKILPQTTHSEARTTKNQNYSGGGNGVNAIGNNSSSTATVRQQQFLDDVSLSLIKFYKAATTKTAQVTTNKQEKAAAPVGAIPASPSHHNSKINNNKVNEDQREDKNKDDMANNAWPLQDNEDEEDVLDDGIFYSMNPEEFLPNYLNELMVRFYFEVFHIIYMQVIIPVQEHIML